MKVFKSTQLKDIYEPILKRLEALAPLSELSLKSPNIACVAEASERTVNLLGKEAFNKLNSSCVLVCGLGGVGAACFSALARSGVAAVGLDADVYDYSNQNRQLHSEFFAEPKAGVIAQLYGAACLQVRLDEQNISLILESIKPDLIIDAVDDVAAKTALALEAAQRKITLFASGGAARRMDTSAIKCERWDKVTGCALSKAVRTRLKASKYRSKHKVVFSTESPSGVGLGSLMPVTASFGLMLASMSIKEILKDKS